MANDYTTWPTLTDVQRCMSSAGVTVRLGSTDLQARYTDLLDQVSDEIAQETVRQFVADVADTTRTYDGTGTAEMEVDEMVSLTSVAIVGIQTAPGYTLSGASLVFEQGKPQTRIVVAKGSIPAYITEGVLVPYPTIFPAGRQNIQVTGRFGFGPTVPPGVWNAVAQEIAYRIAQEALYTQSGRLTERQQGDERERYSLTEARVTGWHEAYRRMLKDWKRPSGRRLRNLRPPMI